MARIDLENICRDFGYFVVAKEEGLNAQLNYYIYDVGTGELVSKIPMSLSLQLTSIQFIGGWLDLG